MFFLGGLPRSGSTLLANILNQNPAIHATETSGLLDIVIPVKNGWNDVTNHQTIPAGISEARLRNVLFGIINSYHVEIRARDRDKIIIDRNRGWLGVIEMLDNLYESDFRLIVTVRDVVDILASLERLNRNTRSLSITSQEKSFPLEMSTVDGRLAIWSRNDQIFGIAYNMLKDVIAKGYRDRILLIEYRDLCAYPNETMDGLYDYLDIESYTHDFDHVVQTTFEDDRVHGFANLHDIRPRVSPNHSKWKDVLGSAGNPYLDQEFWRTA